MRTALVARTQLERASMATVSAAVLAHGHVRMYTIIHVPIELDSARSQSLCIIQAHPSMQFRASTSASGPRGKGAEIAEDLIEFFISVEPAKCKKQI